MTKLKILISVWERVKIASVRPWQASDIKRFPCLIMPCSLQLIAYPCHLRQCLLLVIHRIVHDIQKSVDVKCSQDKIHVRPVHALITKLRVQPSEYCHRTALLRVLTVLQHKIFLPRPTAYIHDIGLCLLNRRHCAKRLYLTII